MTNKNHKLYIEANSNVRHVLDTVKEDTSDPREDAIGVPFNSTYAATHFCATIERAGMGAIMTGIALQRDKTYLAIITKRRKYAEGEEKQLLMNITNGII